MRNGLVEEMSLYELERRILELEWQILQVEDMDEQLREVKSVLLIRKIAALDLINAS
jgi:hypothetical protein